MIDENRFPDTAALAESISRRLPDLTDIEPLEIIGEGFRSLAVSTAGGVLIRIGKLAEAATGFELETRVLPVVRQFVSAPVPEPRWHIPPCDEFPFGALGYRKLPGLTPEPGNLSLSEHFIPELAKFLVSLRSVPVEQVEELGAARVDSMQRMHRARPVVMPFLGSRLSPSQYRLLENWWNDLPTDLSDISYQPKVGHHDLWQENLLVDENGHLSGVLDWSHIEIGDPAGDLAAINHFDSSLVEQFYDEYRTAGGTLTESDLQRVKLNWEGRHLGGLAWAIENNVEEEIEAGTRKLLAGPLLRTD